MPARPAPRPAGRLAPLLLLLAAGCDLTPTLDIETPPYAPAVVLRAVLAAGATPTARVSVSRDPYGPEDEGPVRPPTPTPEGARVTLLRDGVVVEALAPRPQTCYRFRSATCNAETGRTEVEEREPYDCSAFVGQLPVEAGATYTLRAEVPGLPPAEATVTVPVRPDVTVEEEPAGAGRRLRVRLRDVPGEGSRYALALQREFDRYTTRVCARGGPRDTTLVLQTPAWTQTRFGTSDPVLLAGARDPADALLFATFTDETFAGGEHAFPVTMPAPGEGDTGRLSVQLAVLSPVLYDAYQVTSFSPGDDNPFTEPVNLPSNVAGGYGRVGAVAMAEVVVPARP